MRRDPGEPYYRLGTDEARNILADTPDKYSVIDVRAEDEYLEGHVTNAIHIPVDEILSRIEELPKGKTLLFICAAGIRSGLACEMAAATGLDPDSLVNIEDGTPPWIEKGYPTSYGDNP
tara:strand:+ start:350 stop:706 length:357 start_codon:yes stop_codon:yes gene_type:complete